MIREILLIDVALDDTASSGRLLIEKPKRGGGVKFTLLAQGKAIAFGTNTTQTHELAKGIELVTGDEE